jgi:hypothetical protein
MKEHEMKITESHEIADRNAADLAIINDFIYEMFFNQNTIIDLDFRDEMINMIDEAGDEDRDLLKKYAEKIEEFLKYAAENPERVENALAMLKGERETMQNTEET